VNGKPLDVPRHRDVTALEGEGFNFGPAEATSSWSFCGADVTEFRTTCATRRCLLTFGPAKPAGVLEPNQ
jgi:hypothetical protein